MNKLVLSILVVIVAVIALGSAGFVFAQSPTPQAPAPGAGNGTGYGMGMMNGRGNRAGMMGNPAAIGDNDGLLHDAMIAIYAEKLGLSVDELNTRLANGETMAQIATSKGLSADEFRTLMLDARSQAIDQAVQAGTLTQTQADWMKQRGAGMPGASGQGMRGRMGARGAGQGQAANPDCPFYQVNP
jgi:hypothetical protein